MRSLRALMIQLLLVILCSVPVEIRAEVSVYPYRYVHNYDFDLSTYHTNSPLDFFTFENGQFTLYKEVNTSYWELNGATNSSSLTDYSWALYDIDTYLSLPMDTDSDKLIRWLYVTNSPGFYTTNTTVLGSGDFPFYFEYRQTSHLSDNSHWNVNTEVHFNSGDGGGMSNVLALVYAQIDAYYFNPIFDSYIGGKTLDAGEFTVGGLHPDDNGFIRVGLVTNLDLNITPVVDTATYSNYTFTITGQQVILMPGINQDPQPFSSGDRFRTNVSLLALFGTNSSGQITPSIGNPVYIHDPFDGDFIGSWVELYADIPTGAGCTNFSFVQERVLYKVTAHFNDSSSITTTNDTSVNADGPSNQQNDTEPTIYGIDAPRFNPNVFFPYFGIDPPAIPGQDPETLLTELEITMSFRVRVWYQSFMVVSDYFNWGVTYHITSDDLSGVTSVGQ